METHRNRDHLPDEFKEIFRGTERNAEDAWRRLEAEAEQMKAANASSITAGLEDEKPLREWEKYGVFVRELPEREADEDLDLVRVSIGGQETGERIAYCVFRGPIGEVKAVLRRAVNALRDAT